MCERLFGKREQAFDVELLDRGGVGIHPCDRDCFTPRVAMPLIRLLVDRLIEDERLLEACELALEVGDATSCGAGVLRSGGLLRLPQFQDVRSERADVAGFWFQLIEQLEERDLKGLT